MHERFSKRIEKRLVSPGRRLEHARRRLDRETIGRQIGRILGQNTRAAGRYKIEVMEDATRASGLRLLWSVKSEWDEWVRHSAGAYLLRTNVWEWSSGELWRTYVQLTEVEAASASTRAISRSVALPLGGACPQELRIRCAVRPDKAQAFLLDRLGLRLPERFRIPAPRREM